MPLLWLGVDDAPGPGSRRALIERNAITLLSGDAESALDPPSPGWHGLDSDREPVRRSRPLEQPPRGRELRPVVPRRARGEGRGDSTAVANGGAWRLPAIRSQASRAPDRHGT